MAPEATSSFCQALLNILNAVEGIGLLALPHALAIGGWCAVLAVPLFAGLSAYTGCAVVQLTESVTEAVDGLPTFADMAYCLPISTHGRRLARHVLRVFQYTELFGVCVLSIVLGGSLLHQVFESLFETSGLFASQRACILVFALPSIATSLLPSVSSLARLSAFSIISLVIVLVVVQVYALCSTTSAWGKPWARAVFASDRLPVASGILVFGFAAHAQFPGISRSMQLPSRFPGALVLAMGGSALLKLFFGIGVSGALGVDSPEVATAVLPRTGCVRPIIAGLLASSVALSFPLPLFALSSDCRGGRPCRLGLAVAISALAVAMTEFAKVMSLIGSLTGAVLCYVAPCVCRAMYVLHACHDDTSTPFNTQVAIRGETRISTSRSIVAMDIILVVFGTCVGLAGTVQAINELIVR